MKKFRVWDKEKGRFLDWEKEVKYSLVDLRETEGINQYIPYFSCCLSDKKEDRWIISRSTGLFSKKGEEIYEGDIVYWALKDQDEIIQIERGIIEFKNAAFIVNGDFFENETSYLGDYCSMGNKTELEILGNTLENPDLLKVKDEN